MTRQVEQTASSPGALFLFGEYAVLAGGWSVTAAVDRRVRASRFDDVGQYRAEGLEASDEALVRAVLQNVEPPGGEVFEPGRFETDVRTLYEQGTKLGLGSSAASAVALTAVCLADDLRWRDTDADRRRLLELAHRAHAAFQGGLGSGGGVVAGTLGGVVAFHRRTSDPKFRELDRNVDGGACERSESFVYSPVSVPEPLEMRAVWLGEPASTTDFVEAVVEKRRRDPDEVHRRLAELAGLAEGAIEASRRSDPDGFVDCVREADASMERLGEVCEMPVIVERHRQLRDIAEGFDLAVKPSGAGGGDFSLVVGPADADWTNFVAELPEQLDHVDLSFGAPGVRAERTS